ncbi:MAG: SusC/RagA family TonB-linked outer membrane protein, partial [Prevotellaceae bacterium]|nr:SusC/RagA family TonB-linked outer membrane protein [Prevotellaceae bacterium]
MRKIFVPLLLFVPLMAFTQNIDVSGVVGDAANGEPLAGVTVSVSGTSAATMTDLDGAYKISVPQNGKLNFSFVGYRPQTINVNGRNLLNVALVEDATVLEEVVAIGYGTAKRKDITTAVSSILNDDFDVRPIVSAGQAIQGKAAGVSVIQPNGAPGGETVIRVRGTTSFESSSDPLYVVDGVPVDNINFLSPNDILRIDILKDASSAAIYGNRGANGVVIITTKAGQTQREAKISLSTQVTAKMVANQIQSLNAAQYKELMEEIRPGSSAIMGDEDLTNWSDEVYRTGWQQNYQISIQNGTDKYNYFLSAGYLDEKGTLPAAFFKRYNFRASFNNDIRKWLNVGANVSYSDNSSNGINTGNGSNRGGVVLAVVNLPTSVAV